MKRDFEENQSTKGSSMKKLTCAFLCLAVFCTLAEEAFDCKKWSGLSAQAHKLAEPEFVQQFKCRISFSTGLPVWERGNGLGVFVADCSFDYYMKFDADGRLVKYAPQSEFPELIMYTNRVECFAKQLREEYAKSLGLTVEEANQKYLELRRGSLLGRRLGQSNSLEAQRKAREEERLKKQKAREEEQKAREEARLKKEKEEENILRSTAEEIIGLKFGQAPITGVEEKKQGLVYQEFPVRKTQTLRLPKPFRHMKDVELTYYNNKLTSASVFVFFGFEFSDEAIEQELIAVNKRLAEKLGFGSNENMCRLQRGKFSVHGQSYAKKLSLTFTDNQTYEAEITAARKKGRPLPKLPEEL